MSSFDFQFEVLPYASLLVPLVLGCLVVYRKRLSARTIGAVIVSGLLGGIMLVLLLRATHGLPWFVPCLECGALGQWWYSDAVTFLQGCGLGTVAAASLVWARRRITRKERTADV